MHYQCEKGLYGFTDINVTDKMNAYFGGSMIRDVVYKKKYGCSVTNPDLAQITSINAINVQIQTELFPLRMLIGGGGVVKSYQ